MQRGLRLTSLIGFVLIVATARAEAGSPSPGRTSLLGENPGKKQRLDAIDRLLASNQWAAAVDECLRLRNEAGDELVPINERWSLNICRIVNAKIARLPREALSLLRSRQHDLAVRLWQESSAGGDHANLRRLARTYFGTAEAEMALEILGRNAFERGDLDEAAAMWNQIAGTGAAANQALTFEVTCPDQRIATATVKSWQALTLLMAGDDFHFRQEVDRLAVRYPTATGELAGHRGRLVDLLHELEHSAKPSQVTTDWPCAGGTHSRQCIRAEVPRWSSYSQTWSQSIADLLHRSTDGPAITTPTAAARQLLFYPIIANDTVVVAGQIGLRGYDWQTGRLAGSYDLPQSRKILGQGESSGPELDWPNAVVADGTHLFARFQDVDPDRTGEHSAPGVTSYLVCLASPKNGKYTEVWRKSSREHEADNSVYEGVPIVDQGLVYIGFASFSGVRRTSGIDCYDAVRGRKLWRVPMCEAPDLAGTGLPMPYFGLTMAGPNVILCSHNGAVGAVERWSGQRSWGYRYAPRQIALAEGDVSARGALSICYANSRLFVVPADSDRVYCLDGASGQLIWQSNPVEVSQLLGTVSGRLVMTTCRQPRGLRGLDADTGQWCRDWIQPQDGLTDQPAFGQGFVAGGKIFWPTLFGLRVLHADSGELDLADSYYLSARLGAKTGNFAIGRRGVAFADAETLRVFALPDENFQKTSR